MNAVVKAILIGYGVDMAAKIVDDQITDEECAEIGQEIGRKATDLCREKLGEKWENAESVLQRKLNILVDNIIVGVDYDDAVTGAQS